MRRRPSVRRSIRIGRTSSSSGAAVTGLIWGRTWSPTVGTGAADRVRAGQVALALLPDLDDDDLVALAHVAGAVTHLTSLLADHPAWKPGGLADDDGAIDGGIGGGPSRGRARPTFGGSVGGSLGGMGTRGRPPAPDLRALLAGRVAACTAGLTDPGWRLEVELETTGVEVVDVAVRVGGVADAATAARLDACAVEAGWALELDPSFAYHTRTFTESFAP